MEKTSEHGRGVAWMPRRSAALLAWTLWTFCIALVALMGLLRYLTPEVPDGRIPLLMLLLNWVLWLAYPTMGAMITTHRPENPIGWIFLVAGPVFLIPECAAVYTDYAMSTGLRSQPLTPYAVWLGDSGIALPSMMVMTALLFSLFPNGRLLSRNWRVAPWGAVAGGILVTGWMVTWPGPTGTYPSIDNPFGIEGAKDVVEVLGKAGLAVLLVSWVIAAISLMVRREEASSVERQQIRWFAFSLLLIILAFPFAFWSVGPVVVALLPIATAIAIFRYHLYDIDVIINRTLVYGALTVILAGLYFGGVTATQAILADLTGQRDLAPLVIVASTLLIAALFNPLRRRIQSFIDRRFYRRKYDARKTLESFSSKLRDETDLQTLNGNLVGVVGDTMQPEHVSVWLRPDPPTVEANEGPNSG